MHRNAERVQDFLRQHDADGQVRELDASTRTAAEAATALGVEVDQIAKSLIFRAGDGTVLVIAAGGNRVDTKKVQRHLGVKIGRADADWVKEVTGFPIGGVPPVAHASPLEILIDQDLQQYDILWAAAGTPHAVFPTTCDELVRLSGGQLLDIKTSDIKTSDIKTSDITTSEIKT